VTRISAKVWVVTAVVGILFSACGRGDYKNLMDIRVCDPKRGPFSLNIDNPSFPLPVGHEVVLEGKDGTSDLLVRVTVLDEVELVDGVETRVVEEFESSDGRVVEISRNYFVQARDGTVCYFGEVVDNYDKSGKIADHSGTWRAGEGRNRPGIFMPPSPKVGQAFQQEIAPGIAQDQARVEAIGEQTETPAGTFTDTVVLIDRDPLAKVPGRDKKVYARGIGLIQDVEVRLAKFTKSNV
jgi:hypothetical protein